MKDVRDIKEVKPPTQESKEMYSAPMLVMKLNNSAMEGYCRYLETLEPNKLEDMTETALIAYSKIKSKIFKFCTCVGIVSISTGYLVWTNPIDAPQILNIFKWGLLMFVAIWSTFSFLFGSDYRLTLMHIRALSEKVFNNKLVEIRVNDNSAKTRNILYSILITLMCVLGWCIGLDFIGNSIPEVTDKVATIAGIIVINLLVPLNMMTIKALVLR